MSKKSIFYPPLEEKINVISHLIGVILGVIGLIFLTLKAIQYGDIWHLISFPVFGISIILLYTASTVYHNSKVLKVRKRLNVFDHASIYVLIAGTYTPYTLVSLHGTNMGWIVFGIAWGAALIGIILKLFYIGKFRVISTIMYVVMGWIIIIAIKSLMENLAYEGVMWLFAGAIAYMIGALLYSIQKIPYNHAIFHIFVLIGTICHFISIYFYV